MVVVTVTSVVAEAVAGIVEMAVIVLEQVNFGLEFFTACGEGSRCWRDHGCQEVR